MSTKNKVLQDTINSVIKAKEAEMMMQNSTSNGMILKKPEVKDLTEEERKKYSVKMRKRSNVNNPLRRIRIERGFTLDELADRTGMSTSYLSRLESGSRRLNSDIIKSLSDVLNCRPGDLLDYDDGNSGANGNVLNSVMMSSYEVEGATVHHNQNTLAKDLPLYSLRSGKINFSTVSDWIVRIYELNTDKSAFAVTVKDDSLEPRYKYDEILLVSSIKRLTENCSIIVILNNNVDDNDENTVIGNYLGWESKGESAEINEMDLLSVYSYSKKQELKFSRKDIKSVYRIIGTIES